MRIGISLKIYPEFFLAWGLTCGLKGYFLWNNDSCFWYDGTLAPTNSNIGPIFPTDRLSATKKGIFKTGISTAAVVGADWFSGHNVDTFKR